jgi:hypothetical protein
MSRSCEKHAALPVVGHSPCAGCEIERLKDENEVARMRIKELDLLFGRYILAMKASLIEEEHGLGSEGAMMWIYNSLVGPGELPPESETIAQAYFDREVVAIDNGMQEIMVFYRARRAAMSKDPLANPGQ